MPGDSVGAGQPLKEEQEPAEGEGEAGEGQEGEGGGGGGAGARGEQWNSAEREEGAGEFPLHLHGGLPHPAVVVL